MGQQSRPLAQKSTSDLRKMVEADPLNTNLRDSVRYELKFRNRSAARQLLEELGGGSSEQPRIARRRRATDAQELSEPECDELRAVFEALRTTFTERGSVLARWGMSESMPQDMLEEVMSCWAARCTDTPDQLGRSQQTLRVDLECLGIGLSARGSKRGTGS
jgi:hypothetical protein